MDLSFILLTWNSREFIQPAIDSILAGLPNGHSVEIFVVDNGSTDGTVDLLEAQRHRLPNVVRPIFLDCNRGTTYPRNLALRQARGRYIVVMDSDVVVHADTLTILARAVRREEQVGLAAPRLLFPSGNLQKSTDRFPTLWNKIYRYFFLRQIERREQCTRFTGPCEVDYAISAFWMMPRAAVETVGLLDEGFFYAPEDVDYCIRVWKAGFRILYVPHATAVHHTQELSRGFRLNQSTFRHIQGLVRYFRKHGYLFRRPRFGDPAERVAALSRQKAC
jgi:GT2 family glycosyltransferase